ncbi:MAG: tetraacyldisaccharide 4'-kinase [Campylobacterota bacterium]|nr:tetraacyldisaccharide 4'-kinase [Campylobacterota bacterium]
MKRTLVAWVERLFYAPSFFDSLISYLLYPLSLLYCSIVWFRFKTTKVIDFKIAVVSVGNLTVGGSGKTPLVSALASGFKKPCIVLRGYGRQSQGLIVVSDGTEITCNIFNSGDEAIIYAKKLPYAVVIVSEKRDAAIIKAKELQCDVVFLDDGYSKHHIKKYDILIDVTTPNTLCLPAGPFRERLWQGKQAYIAYEKVTFKRMVSYHDLTEKMVLVTAIARPERLKEFLPKNVIDSFFFPDHHYFTKEELLDILKQSGATSLLVTYKDYVKLVDFNIPLSLMDLDLEVDAELVNEITSYVKNQSAV